MITIDASIEILDEIIDIEFDDDDVCISDSEINGLYQYNDNDHSTLRNLGKPDQHPISAIKNLSIQLNNKLESVNTITNQEILNILNS